MCSLLELGGGLVEALVIVPTFDERVTIEPLLASLMSHPHPRHVLVVDDGSPDGTGAFVAQLALVEPRVRLLQRRAKGGLGSAYRSGYAEAMAMAVDVICQMDADLSHDPDQLEGLLAAVADGADVAVGSRYVSGGDVRGWSWRRVALSKAANLFVRVVTGCPVRDSTSGFRAYRAEVLDGIGVADTRSDGYAFQIEMTLRAVQERLDVREVPITFVEREHGTSKLSRSVTREAFFSVLRWGWQLRRGASL
jgi:dolichol-phosphate mannosyltransferase